MESSSGSFKIKGLKTEILRRPPPFSRSQLISFALIFAIIGGYVLFRTFAASPIIASVQGESMSINTVTSGSSQTVTFEAENMTFTSGGSVYTDTTASGGKALLKNGGGTVTGSFSLPAAATSLIVTAKSTFCSNVGANMVVAVDGNQVLSTTAASTAWAPYTAAVNLAAGTHSLTISFTNDAYTAGVCDRNLYLDKTDFAIPGSTTAPPGAYVVNDTSASNGQEMEITGNRTISSSFSLPSSATSLVVITKASLCSNVGAAMVVKVDGTQLISTTVSSTSLTTVSANTTLAAGSHSLTISFTNDAYTAGVCDRNLYIDVTNFYGSVTPPPPVPTVSLGANPTSLTAGSSSTLTWSSTNATSCTASGSWSGSEPTSGSISTGALNQTGSYTLTCTGVSGSDSATATVPVTPAGGSGSGSQSGITGASKAVCSPGPCGAISSVPPSFTISTGQATGDTPYPNCVTNCTTRTFQIGIPANLQVQDKTHPVPMMLVFPDSCQQPSGCFNIATDGGPDDWDAVAPTDKLIVVDMFPDSPGPTGNFNTPVVFGPVNGEADCGTGVCDDGAEVAGIVAYMKSHYAIDSTMIFAGGGSKGGDMTQEVACDPLTAPLFAGLVMSAPVWIAKGADATGTPTRGGSCPALLQPGTFTPAVKTHPTMLQYTFSWNDTAQNSCTGATAGIAPYTGGNILACQGGGLRADGAWEYTPTDTMTRIINPAYGCSNTPINWQNPASLSNGTYRQVVNTYKGCTGGAETQIVALGNLNAGSGCHAYGCTGQDGGYDLAQSAWNFWTTGTTTP